MVVQIFNAQSFQISYVFKSSVIKYLVRGVRHRKESQGWKELKNSKTAPIDWKAQEKSTVSQSQILFPDGHSGTDLSSQSSGR